MRKLGAGLSAVIVLASSLLVYKYDSEPSNGATSRSHSQLSLIDALHVGMLAAKKWDADAIPLYMTSVDDELGDASGQEGTRSKWNLQVGTSANKRAVVVIRNGKVEKIISGGDPYDQKFAIATDRIKMDSTIAISKSKRTSHLLPGKGKENGYHFILQGGGRFATITVVGRDEHDRIRQIKFDAVSGRILSE